MTSPPPIRSILLATDLAEWLAGRSTGNEFGALAQDVMADESGGLAPAEGAEGAEAEVIDLPRGDENVV